MLNNLHQSNQDKVNQQLNAIQEAAIKNENLFEHLMEAQKVCSLGQITSALFEVGGQYRRKICKLRAIFFEKRVNRLSAFRRDLMN
jgi:methylmalonyl-CoA mutase